MPRKKPSKESLEQKEYQIFNPDKIKNAVEIPVKPRPTIEELETVEVVGKGIDKSRESNSEPKPSFSKTKTRAKTAKPKAKASQGLTNEFKEKKLNPQGYVLIITEKPQAAGKIAAALSDGKERRVTNNGVSYYELERNKKKIIVACAVGHLFTVAQTKKGVDYPIFDIAWYPNFQIKKKDFTKKYYSVIEKLAKGASEIVVATDFDVEGEVIGYNIIRFIAGQKDAKRMKYSSLTAKELQESYDNSHPTIEWGQAIAGETRHFVDWLYGINLSRALMSSIKSIGKFKIMSIGRVQGPALNLIVEKEKEIISFKSSKYWQVFITINDGKKTLELKYVKDITKKEELEKFKGLVGKKVIALTTKKKEIVNPPAPFDLTTLQTESYKFYSITPSQALQIAQKLYLAGVISYPRTSSQKIPDSMEPLKILKKLGSHFPETQHATKPRPIEGKKSDPAHPAIIPTGNFEKLDGQEKKIYELIVKRFIACFCDSAELENKKVEVDIDNLKFNEKGMEIVKKGWMDVYPTKMQEKEVKDFNGEVNIDKERDEEKETQPPKRYSPASIVTELEKRNLGTKATRANIIETLYDRNYIKDKSIKATELGIRLIDSLKKHSPVIIDEKLTREIEKDMDNIRESKKELNSKKDIVLKKSHEALTKISDGFKKNEKDIGKELDSANTAIWNQEKEDNKLGITCPNCNKGILSIKYTPRFRSYFVACSEYPNCKQTFSLPSNSLIKKTEKICPECNYPMLMSIKKGKRPWVFCFNPKCPSRQNKDKKPVQAEDDDSGEEE